MRFALLTLAGVAGLAAASPVRPRQISTDPNAPCGAQPFGFGAPSTTDANFEQNPAYAAAALGAPAPAGFSASFRNLNGSSQQDGYAGYYYLQSYNTSQCADFCHRASGCAAFNLYFERDPLQNPAYACPDPAPTTNIKCALYTKGLSPQTATNTGQFREQFHVVIAGSDGFNALWYL